MMREKLENLINTALKELKLNEFVNTQFGKIYSIDYPKRMDFGDYSTNVGIIIGGSGHPEDILKWLDEHKPEEVEKIETKAGFINFFLSPNYFENVLKNLEIPKNSDENLFIEHTQPNPFKAFHIGHLMNNAIGESIARITKSLGAEVQTATYHGDKGLHVAKAVWAIKKGKNLNEAYAFGNKAYEEDQIAKEEIIEINKKIYDESDPEINQIYEDGRKESLEHFESIYKMLGSEFDFHFFESETGEVGKELVEENLGKVFEKSEGAVVFKGENFEPKTHTRVFLNSDGLPTYEAKELGIAKLKSDFFDFDKSITITANEQDSFFKVVEVVIGEVMPELKGKIMHLSHGLLKLPTGKMSSRTGSIISVESLIDQVKEKVKAKIDDDKISEIIALGAIKYSILRQGIGKDIIFDFDKSISFEGDSGPYLQYSTVRARSLLKKAEGVIKLSNKLPESWQTTNLERMLERFPSIVARAGSEFAPHYVATYLIQLASEFNHFYNEHKIIDEKDPKSPYRLTLVKAFSEVMEMGLDLLAIKIPDRM